MEEKSEIKSRLFQFLAEKGLSQAKFEKACGFSIGYVNKIGKGIGTDKLLDTLRTYPDLSRDWLLDGTGPMLRSQIGNNTSVNGNGNNIANGNNANVQAPAAEYLATITELQKQNARLIGIIEKLTTQ